MSFNLNTKVNNLQAQISAIIAGSVTNPLSSTLNGNNQSITNVNTLSSVSGSPLNITAGASTVNFASEVNMVDTLTINNNTVHNGLVVKDGIGDTSCFVVDQSGNVGIKVNPSSALTTDFTVTGNSLVTGNLTVNGTFTGAGVVNNITAGTGLIKTGTSSNPTLTNSGVLTVASGGAGSGISVTGTQNPVISTNLAAGSNISFSTVPLTGALEISATSGPSTWVGTATSALNMSAYSINNVGPAASATDVPQTNNVQSAMTRLPGTGYSTWSLAPNFFHTLGLNSFTSPPQSLDVYGSIYNGTPYQESINTVPPSKFTINFRCPVAKATTNFSPNTNLVTNIPYYIRCELFSWDANTSIVSAWLDTQTVIGWISNTGPLGSPANVPYLSFSVTLCSNVSVSVDSGGFNRAIGLNFTMYAAAAPTGANSPSYAFNPSGSDAGVGLLPYQDCFGIETCVTTLANSNGSGF